MKLKAWCRRNVEICAILASMVLLGISSLFSWDDNPIIGLDKMCADLLIVLVCILLIRVLGIWNTAGFQKEGFRKGLVYGIPFLVLGVGSVVVSNLGTDFSKLSFVSVGRVVLFTINMIFVGMNEEIWMRAFVLNGLLSKYGSTKKAVWKAILVSALIFGAIHIPNLFFMEPITLVVQVVNAAAGGVLFAVIFIKSKNIWAGIVVHTIVDWCSLFVANCFSGANSVLSMEMNLGQACIMILLGSLPPIVISILLLRGGRIEISQ